MWSESAGQGVASNVYGFYTLTLPAGTYDVRVNYIGYASQRFEVDLSSDDVKFNVELTAGLELGEAVVTGEQQNRIEEQVQMSRMEIPIDQIRSPPSAARWTCSRRFNCSGSIGRKAPAGSTSVADLRIKTSCCWMGCRLYNVSHLFGFFSVFNADAVKSMSITKGGFPRATAGVCRPFWRST